MKRASDAWPAARAASKPAGLTALPIERRKTGKGCNLTAGEPSEFGHARQKACGYDWSNAGCGA